MNTVRYIITFFIVLIGFAVSAQDYTIKIADKKFKDQLYNDAIELYKKAYDEEPDSYYVIKRLALANQRINNTEEAGKWMGILIKRGKTISADLKMYAELLIENGKFSQAKKYLDQYVQLKPNDREVDGLYQRLDYIETMVKDSADFKISSVNINTPGAEIGTIFFRNGIIFSSTSLTGTNKDNRLEEDELPFLDLYFSEEIMPGQFSTPVPFAPNLKTRFNDGPVSYDPTENLFYITRYAPKEANREGNAFLLHLQIVVAEEKDGEWNYKEDFFMNSPDFSVAHPSVSPDGKLIYFASDMPGGYGGFDIYFCYKTNNGKWSEPYNVGPVVNSDGDEYFPFINNRGNLYFSSNGHSGLGGQDIFLATSEEGVYNTIKNLGYPVNSPKDDVAMVLAPGSERGYFSSNRVESLGYYDIYSVKINYIPVSITGYVKDVDNKSVLANAVIKLMDIDGNLITEGSSGSDGSFSFTANKIPTLQLWAGKDGYDPIQKMVGIDFLKPNEELMLEVFMRKK